MSVFVDTSALLAVLDADDREHVRARRAWERLVAGGESLLSSSYVLVETSALAQRRLGMDAVRALHEDVCPILAIEWVDEAVHRAGVEAMLAQGRRRLSLVDCVSFEVMRRSGVVRAFCFDPHFTEAGFRDVAAGLAGS